MITVDQLPEKSVDAARLAMAIALANDGDGIPECIAAALSAWPNGYTTDAREAWPAEIILPITETSTKENNNG